MSNPNSPYDIIRTPVITEKAGDAKDNLNKVTFLVNPRVGKIAIRKAIESVFGVTVEKVNLLNQKGKRKKLGRYEGKRPDRKKAIVTLKEGDNIEVFDQV
ncbi:MAG: 50S ribosomal protein L23 [Nitrospinota bacterium]|nr:50S ribosomal protein L23 [Nitrospinota bacterium]MDH5677371.1 50S ribosomal protein L23 [Nitrospinota bacterium]MDH5757092.1 50S ribosomal protein L23 [Nitrospinota bacterium]